MALRLERFDGFQGARVQIPLRSNFYTFSKKKYFSFLIVEHFKIVKNKLTFCLLIYFKNIWQYQWPLIQGWKIINIDILFLIIITNHNEVRKVIITSYSPFYKIFLVFTRLSHFAQQLQWTCGYNSVRSLIHLLF